jgi:RNA polymerase sigma factor (sigma-70 family)
MNKFSELTEIEVINKVLKGEKTLYEIIVRRFNSVLYKVGRSYNYNHDDTQDLMQDTYIDAYKNLNQFEQKANFKTWLIRIMLNNCYRKKQKFSFKNEKATDFVNENISLINSNHSNDIMKKIHNRDLGNIIEDSLSKLQEDYRLVFSLREINGLSVAETANLLDITESNVKVRLNRAKTQLRTEIEKSYTATELFDFNLSYCNPFTEKLMQTINNL